MKKRPPIQTCQQNLFEVDPVVPEPKPKQRSDDGFVLDILDIFQSPVLTYGHGWADTIPQRLLDNVVMARLIAAHRKENLATYVEASIYIYSRCLESPMPSDWVDIYTHVSCTVCAEYFNEDHWDEVPAPRKLTAEQMDMLDNLRRHIYNKRREYLKQKLKAAEAARPDPEPEPSSKDLESTQQSLFA